MYSRIPVLPLSVIVTALLSTGCPLVELEVEAGSVCVSIERVEFDVSPEVELVDGVVSLESTVDATELAQAISSALTAAHFTSTFVLTQVEARLNPGPTVPQSFEFVEGLQIVARAPLAELPATLILDCEDCSVTGSEFDQKIDPVDMSSFINSGELVLDVTVLGQPPQEAWSMSVDLCFASTARYERSL